MSEQLLNLEKFQRIVSNVFSEGIFNDTPFVDLHLEPMVRGWAAIVRGDLFGKDCGKYSYQAPANWWEHLKMERPFLQRLFGEPKMVRTELFLRVVLDPKSKKIPTVNEVVLTKLTAPPKPEYKFEDMVFYPTIFVNRAAE